MDLTPLAPFVRDKPWMEEEPTRSPKDSLIYANPNCSVREQLRKLLGKCR
jgi:hypothetical protein